MRPDPDAEGAPSELEESEPGGEPSPLDLSPLAAFDVAGVPITRRQIHGLVTVSRGHTPLDAVVGQPCGDPSCRYRSVELRLHPGIEELMDNFAVACEAQGLAPGAFIGQFDRDVYLVSSTDAVATADLTDHPILYRVPLSLDRLHEALNGTLEWELVRTIRDGCRTSALELPLANGYSGRELLVHHDLAEQLALTCQGSMDDLTPILSADAREELALARRLARLFKRSRPD